ncbi:hypothetical protein [Polaromonas sp.]|uniref:hypothetical protein n=1 Tax=Polaromonas sp. TaxID=1869339 RepID=UPI00352B4F91
MPETPSTSNTGLSVPSDSATPPPPPTSKLGPRLELGYVRSTREALALLQRAGVSSVALANRHARGDWGDIDAPLRTLNEEALRNKGEVKSIYKLQVPYPETSRTLEETICCVTDMNRRITTFMLPEEY